MPLLAAPVAQASGVLINMRADVLTARHVVTDCTSLYVVKGSQVVRATVRAVSNDIDAAVLQTTLKPMLAATFIDAAPSHLHSMAVFSESYAELQTRQDRSRLLGNALTVPGEPGSLQMLSSARPGASGSAVLDGGGLLLGIVAQRVAAGNGRAPDDDTPSPTRQGMASVVRAVPAAELKAFLLETGIPFAQSKLAQLGAQQSPASRAATLSVGIICG